MASVQIHPRIDSEVWESLRLPGEKDTALLQRLCSEHIARSERDKKLAQIDQNLDAALAVTIHSHQVLTRLLDGASLSLPAIAEQKKEEPAPKKSLFNTGNY